jgi:hypothetical protein
MNSQISAKSCLAGAAGLGVVLGELSPRRRVEARPHAPAQAFQTLTTIPQQTQRLANHFTGGPVKAGLHLGVDDPFQFGGKRYVHDSLPGQCPSEVFNIPP